MWEWFMVNGVWIILVVAVVLALFPLLCYWASRIIKKITPKPWQKRLKSTQRVVTQVIIAIGGVFLLLAITAVIVSRYQIDSAPAVEAVTGWLFEHGILILIIILVSYLTYVITRAVIPRIIDRFITVRGKGHRAKEELAKRSQALSSTITYAIGIILIVVTLFMVLSEVGIDIAPLLAGAGVAGIAIALGAQSLIKDLISGFFIMVEDQYGVGDVIRVAEVTGIVEGLNLRKTLLRNLDGILHTVPNGEIRLTSNFTRVWSRAHLNISVAYKEDLDRVMSLIRKIWEGMAEDPNWKLSLISKTPWLLRVNEFGDSGIIIKVVGDTQPVKQWDVMGELRRRIKRVFDEEGIEIPWPHVKLYLGESEENKGATCAACSKVNLPGSKFCSNCGASLGP